MPANRNALIRYRTIDSCLQNVYRRWTLNDLIDACSDALFEYEGIDKGVSRRTIQSDIQIMRSDKLGYNAPIIVIDKKYYTYADRDYSITNIPITDQDLSRLNETVEFLKQFKGFSHFSQLDGLVQKLEDHVYSQKSNQNPVVNFEKNDNLKGLQFLDVLYQSIIKKKAVYLSYQSFKARQPGSFNFHPYLLKEYRNRWFIIGSKDKDERLINLALDRIIKIEKSATSYNSKDEFDADKYFEHTIGVSVLPNQPPEKIKLFVTHKHAPYVLTKPFHSSQKIVERDLYGVIISLEVQHNFELEKEILGLGDGIKVIEPERLKRSIKQRLLGGLDLYNTEINESGLEKASKKLKYKGFGILHSVYSTREVNRIKKMLHKYHIESNYKYDERDQLFIEVPALIQIIFNKNLKRIISSIDEDAFLTKAIYIHKTKSNINDSWHQDKTINIDKEVELEGFSNWTFEDNSTGIVPPIEILQNIFSVRIHLTDTNYKNGTMAIMAGSHNKILSDNEIDTIISNSVPVEIEVNKGGIQLFKPLLLHSHSKPQTQTSTSVIHLEFASINLPSNMKWKEYQTLNIEVMTENKNN